MTDQVKITIKAGDGGDGAVSFHREKFVTKGGPDGGDGGRGGSVYFVADNNTSTLDDFRSKKVFSAEDGEAGKKLKMYGKYGEDLVISVPAGTLVFDMEGEKRRLVADLNKPGERFLIARGGRGGKGNYKFKSSTNQTPTQYIPGEPGEERTVTLELKLLADIGLIGLPSAGKTTLINTLAHTNAKVADYHFTTLTPNLGVWEVEKGRKVIVADIPGLIEGAAEGKGLGDDFLRHIERTKVLVHVLDPLFASGDEEFENIDPDKVYQNYLVIMGELEQYKAGLWDVTEKPQVVVLNKVDITEVRESADKVAGFFKKKGIEVLPISAATGEGADELRKKVLILLSQAKEPEVKIEPMPRMFTIDNLPGGKRPVLTKDVKGLV